MEKISLPRQLALLVVVLAVVDLPSDTAAAQLCADTTSAAHVEFLPGGASFPEDANCGVGFRCYEAVAEAPHSEVLALVCNPWLGGCPVRATLPLRFPGNRQNPGGLGDSLVKIFWERSTGCWWASAATLAPALMARH